MLADDFVRISKVLESASTQDNSYMLDQPLSMEQAAHHHRRLAENWDISVEKPEISLDSMGPRKVYTSMFTNLDVTYRLLWQISDEVINVPL